MVIFFLQAAILVYRMPDLCRRDLNRVLFPTDLQHILGGRPDPEPVIDPNPHYPADAASGFQNPDFFFFMPGNFQVDQQPRDLFLLL